MNSFGYTERTYRLRNMLGAWCWMYDDTGLPASPPFDSEREAQNWIDERTAGQFVVQTKIEQPT